MNKGRDPDLRHPTLVGTLELWNDFKCKDCPSTFVTRRGLSWHNTTAHHNPLHQCQKCDFSSTMRSRVEAHLETVHERPWMIPNNEEEDPNPDPDPNETTSRQDDNPDDPEPMDEAPVPDVSQKAESTNPEMESPRYGSCLDEHGDDVHIPMMFHLYNLILVEQM